MKTMQPMSTPDRMKKSAVKPNTLRVYLAADAMQGLQDLCELNELGQNELLTKIAVAGIRALKESQGRILLPLRLKVMDEPAPSYVLNDAPPHEAKPRK